MAEPFLGEIRMFAFDFAPKDWTWCNGQTLPIAQNQALYSLLGTHFGGNGSTNFGLPDYRGRTPVHLSFSLPGYQMGNHGGQETVTLTTASMPNHNHPLMASTQAGTRFIAYNDKVGGGTQATAQVVAGAAPVNYYGPAPSNVGSAIALHPQALSSTGGGQAHNNMQPSLVLQFSIALTGIYPPRN